jgi:hypothetical protein
VYAPEKRIMPTMPPLLLVNSFSNGADFTPCEVLRKGDNSWDPSLQTASGTGAQNPDTSAVLLIATIDAATVRPTRACIGVRRHLIVYRMLHYRYGRIQGQGTNGVPMQSVIDV